jgi:cysteine desulfurase
MSAVRNNPNKKHLITTKVEHSSILETMHYLEKCGYKVTYLEVDELGRLNLEELEKAITKDTLLITVMFANNEIGNIYPIKEIGTIAHQHNILFHVDAVQAVGKVKIDVKELNIDSLSLSGHKIHAPKGVGILYMKESTPYIPFIFGGHQEKGLRGGTENVPYIVGLGKAAELLYNNDEEITRIKKLRDKLENDIISNISDVNIYGDLNNRLPNTTNIAFKGIKGEELLLLLETNNICVSTGSACNSESVDPSHVLLAIKADLESSSPIRISLSKYTTEEEIDIAIKKIINIVNMKRKK